MELFAAPGEWLSFDPDHRRNPPEVKDAKGKFLYYLPHCCQCNRPMSGNAGVAFKCVDVDWDNIKVRNNPLGKELIGEDCWKKVLKMNNKSK